MLALFCETIETTFTHRRSYHMELPWCLMTPESCGKWRRASLSSYSSERGGWRSHEVNHAVPHSSCFGDGWDWKTIAQLSCLRSQFDEEFQEAQVRGIPFLRKERARMGHSAANLNGS